jgi:hypothetical protein
MKAWMIFSFMTLLYLISILSFFLHSNFELFYIILLIEITFITGWFYSLAKFYYSRIPRFKGLKLMLLKIGLLVAYLYTLSMAILSLIDYSMVSKVIFYLLPIHFYSMFSMFYCIYFISKSSVSFALGTEATFEQFIKTFFLLWFFPIGVWFIQPQVNKLVRVDFNENS